MRVGPLALLCALACSSAQAADGATPDSSSPPPPTEESPSIEPAGTADSVSETSSAPVPAESLTVTDEPEEEIVVFGDLQVARRRGELDRSLRQQGYKAGRRKDGRTVYRPKTAWKPSVEIYDDGFVIIRRSPPRFESYVRGDSPLRWIACVPPFTPMCVKLGGWMASPARIRAQKGKVAMAVDPDLRQWQQAIVDRAITAKVDDTLPRAMDALWYTGQPLEGEQPPITDLADRRKMLLRHWSTRTCTPEGDRVAEAVALFLEYEVGTSDAPATRAELDQANRATTCTRRLDFEAP